MLSPIELMEKLRYKIQKENLTQAYVAKALEVNPSTVSNWLSGRRKVNLYSYCRLVEFLKQGE